ncbi:MAG: cupin domain-containing protein [Anaerolineae bacterium]|nr:cupin domain-containing protein [Anaerolineae bacterium]
MKQQIIPAGEGKDYDWSNDHIFVKTTGDSTDGRVTIVEDTLKPRFHLARHHHKKMTEIFYVLEGEIAFAFDDETVIATPGMTINIPPNTWHDVKCAKGGKLITIFSPGGFDQYLEELASLSQEQFADEALMTALAEKYDTWMRSDV